MSRPFSQKTIDALQWYLSHPGAYLAGVAAAYGIHYQTLSNAIKSHKKTPFVFSGDKKEGLPVSAFEHWVASTAFDLGGDYQSSVRFLRSRPVIKLGRPIHSANRTEP